MTLQVSSWLKFAQKEMVPVCQENDILLQDDDIVKYLRLSYGYKVDLQLCWSYFAKNYECQLIKSEFDDPQEAFFFHLYNFRICFEIEEPLTKKYATFTLNYELTCRLENEKYNYVADHHGFALIFVSFSKLELYYLDFQKKFNTYVNIPFVIDRTFVKLVNRTVWIFNNSCYGSTDVNAICIKDKNEWFHVKCCMLHVVDLKNFSSRNMLIGTETDSRHRGQILFKDCSMLFIDFSVPVPGETKVLEFAEFFKPEELRMEQDLFVVGIVNTSLFLTYKDKSKVFLSSYL